MQTNKTRRSRRLLSEIIWFAGIFIVVFGARSSLADHYHVPSGSMEFTLMPGDRVAVDKRAYGLRVPFSSIEIREGNRVARGEIVIFDSPIDGTRLIKRIVAVGGDQVVLRNGQLQINGVGAQIDAPTNTERLGERRYALNLTHGGGPNIRAVVPQHHVLALGDHRGNSRDGRAFGFVPESAIYGRAVAVYYRRDQGFRWMPL